MVTRKTRLTYFLDHEGGIIYSECPKCGGRLDFYGRKATCCGSEWEIPRFFYLKLRLKFLIRKLEKRGIEGR